MLMLHKFIDVIDIVKDIMETKEVDIYEVSNAVSLFLGVYELAEDVRTNGKNHIEFMNKYYELDHLGWYIGLTYFARYTKYIDGAVDVCRERDLNQQIPQGEYNDREL